MKSVTPATGYVKSIVYLLSYRDRTRAKATTQYTGYIASAYYLPLFDGAKIEPIISDDTMEVETSFVKAIFDETEKKALQLVEELNKKSVELNTKENALSKKEEVLNQRESNIKLREQHLSVTELRAKYEAEFSLVRGAVIKLENQIILFGKDFWLQKISKLVEINNKTGQQFDGTDYWYLAQMYYALEMYWEHYDSLCEMLSIDDCNDLYEYEVDRVIKHISYRELLICKLEDFVNTAGESEKRDEYKKFIVRLRSE